VGAKNKTIRQLIVGTVMIQTRFTYITENLASRLALSPRIDAFDTLKYLKYLP
jgi:hypothetical protein